jgi:hypothetical protein
MMSSLQYLHVSCAMGLHYVWYPFGLGLFLPLHVLTVPSKLCNAGSNFEFSYVDAMQESILVNRGSKCVVSLPPFNCSLHQVVKVLLGTAVPD